MLLCFGCQLSYGNDKGCAAQRTDAVHLGDAVGDGLIESVAALGTTD